MRDQRIHMTVHQTLFSTASRINANRIQALDVCDPNLLFADEVRDIIRGKMEQMPPRMREVFIASRFEGKTYQEIASQMGIPVRSVTAEIQKALDILRGALKDYAPGLITMLTLFEGR